MPIYRITSDIPERTTRVAMRFLGRKSTFNSIVVDGDDLLVDADEIPHLPGLIVTDVTEPRPPEDFAPRLSPPDAQSG